MIFVRLIETKEPVGFYFLELFDDMDDDFNEDTIKALFFMIDEELDPYACEFTEIANDGYNKFAMIFPNKMKRVPYEPDEPELGTYWEGTFTMNSELEDFVSNDEDDERIWHNFNDKEPSYYWGWEEAS